MYLPSTSVAGPLYLKAQVLFRRKPQAVPKANPVPFAIQIGSTKEKSVYVAKSNVVAVRPTAPNLSTLEFKDFTSSNNRGLEFDLF